MSMQVLHTSGDLDAALEKSFDHAIVVFKHSATCPFSARAQEQVASAKHDLDIYGIVIQYAEDLSAAIAERLSVEHASPQAIVVKDGKAVWNGWRDEIQAAKLEELAA